MLEEAKNKYMQFTANINPIIQDKLEKIKTLDVPLWKSFFLFHLAPGFVLGFINAVSNYEYLIPIKMLYLPYFIFSSWLVFKTAKTTERDWDKSYNNNFLAGLAMFVVVLQWLAYFVGIFP